MSRYKPFGKKGKPLIGRIGLVQMKSETPREEQEEKQGSKKRK